MNKGAKILFFANTEHNADCAREHLAAIQTESAHHWFVVNSLTNRMAHRIDLSKFDAVGFHYSIHPHERYYCSPELKENVASFPGVVFQFLQDEYQNVGQTSRAMAEIGTDVLFTIVKPELHYQAYNHPALNEMRRVTVMAGYAPRPLSEPVFVPLADRPLDLFYRSRVCPLCAGRLGYEKSLIAREVSRRAPEYGLKVDVSVREEDRIYGEDWTRALSSCRATLGSESGASIWDWDGSIEERIDRELGKHPYLSFEELFERVMKPHDGKITYSSISPRIFEAAALKTPQILFPGWYNGLIKPGVHYLQLERDFSNFDEIVSHLRNDDLLNEIANNAYRDLIHSEQYTEKELGLLVNKVLTEELSKKEQVANCSISEAERELDRVGRSYPLQNLYQNIRAELQLGYDQLTKICANPRYRGLAKFGRIFELLKRYLTHLQPRIGKSLQPLRGKTA